mgnify:CR=1 FL=1
MSADRLQQAEDSLRHRYDGYVGVFDSGVGGLTAVKELRALLPHEDIVYFGDTSRTPYGNRSRDTILRYARQDVNFLLSQKVKMIIAACGTVSSVAASMGQSLPVPFTGVLTLGVCSVGLLSKRFTEAIESLDFRAYHALESMGVPLLLRIRYAVLPQLLPALASAVLYRFDVNIREASVLGLVGAGGIGAPLIFAMNHYKWSEAGAIALGLILLVWCIDRLSASLRR